MTAVQLTSDQSATERWKPIPGWEGYYSASDMGRIRSLDRVVPHPTSGRLTVRGRVLDVYDRVDGHCAVSLCRGDLVLNPLVHRLVMAAFVGPCPDGMEVCHNNGVPNDNRLTNLRYDTASSNHLDRVKHGVHHWASKHECPRGHHLISPNLVPAQLKKGRRECLACARARSYVYPHPDLKPHFKEIADKYFEAIMRDAEPPAA